MELTVQACLTILISTSLWAAGHSKTQPSGIVAAVGKREITHKEIRMPQESLRLKYRLLHGKYPESDAELAQLRQLSIQTEKELLTSKIQSLVRETQIRRFGIQVTEQEQIDKRQEQLKNIDRERMLSATREKASTLLQALNAVRSGTLSPEQAYGSYLSKYMTNEEWLVHQQYYTTSKRLAILESAANMTEADLEKPDAGVRALLLDEKLNEKIEKEIAGQDPEFAQYLEARSIHNVERMRTIEKGNPRYLEMKRAEWWRSQYERADIRIFDKTYQDVLDKLTRPVHRVESHR